MPISWANVFCSWYRYGQRKKSAYWFQHWIKNYNVTNLTFAHEDNGLTYLYFGAFVFCKCQMERWWLFYWGNDQLHCISGLTEIYFFDSSLSNLLSGNSSQTWWHIESYIIHVKQELSARGIENAPPWSWLVCCPAVFTLLKLGYPWVTSDSFNNDAISLFMLKKSVCMMFCPSEHSFTHSKIPLCVPTALEDALGHMKGSVSK